MPQNTADGHGVQALGAVSVERNPAAASSARHSFPDRSGDASPTVDAACHHPGPWPKTTSHNAFGSGSTARKIPPGARRPRRPKKLAVSSCRRAQVFTAKMISKAAPSRPSLPSWGDHRRAETPVKDSAKNESRAACSASTLVAR